VVARKPATVAGEVAAGPAEKHLLLQLLTRTDDHNCGA
jgi:hypothetical protein